MPWGRLDDSLYDHPKLDLLPADERLAGIGLWARAISWCNRFLTDGHVPRARIEKLDGTTQLADMLVAAGLFEVDASGYRVHDFLAFNDSRATVLERRAKETKRKADYRAGKGKEPRPAGTTSGTARSDDANVPASVPGGVPASVPAGQPGAAAVSREVSRRDSRERAGAGAIAESRPDPTRPDPDSLSRDSARRRAARADVAALHDRGWKRVTKAQRAVLDEVLSRHDVTGPEFAAEVIRATPPDRDPLAEVMAADHRWQTMQRRAADEADAAWAETKADERATAGETMTRLEDSVPWLGRPAEVAG